MIIIMAIQEYKQLKVMYGENDIILAKILVFNYSQMLI